jgi:uncharacterized repeat protein (TIGR01451 family)
MFSASTPVTLNHMNTATPVRAFRQLSRLRQLLLAAAWLLALGGFAHAQDDLGDVVQLRLEMYLVTMEDGNERFTSSITARPGQVVEYRVLAVNRGDTELQAGTVVVTVPVPEGAVYIEGTATPIAEDMLIEFSANGTDYSTPPVLVTRGGTRGIAEPETYTGIRWTLLSPMAPGQEEVFTFRVTVE